MKQDNSKGQQGKFVHRTPISMKNPEVGNKDYDWWDELCKAHGAKNHWKKKKKKKKKGGS